MATLKLVKQRAEGDCGLAAIATLLSRTHTYEDVQAAAAAIDPHCKGTRGLRVRQLRLVARRLGLELEWRRRYVLDEDSGLLVVHGPHAARNGHAVAAHDGLLWDPLDDAPSPWREYRTYYRARFGTLLRVA